MNEKIMKDLEHRQMLEREQAVVQDLRSRGLCVDARPEDWKDSSLEELHSLPLTLKGSPLSETLLERGSRYGDFTNNARVAQQLREIVRGAESWGRMSLVQREALDAIILKISRIVTGDPGYPDNWHDIQGFAKLVEDRIAPAPSYSAIATP